MMYILKSYVIKIDEIIYVHGHEKERNIVYVIVAKEGIFFHLNKLFILQS